MELTHKNHFKIGYNGSWFNWRTSADDIFEVCYGRCERRPQCFGAECVATAHLIHRKTDSEIAIFFSGGADSEVLVRAFLRAQVPFRIVIIRFEDDLNLHDIGFAQKFCGDFDIKPIYLDLDIIDFFESGLALEYAENTHSVSPQFLHHMWAMDQVDGFPVLGSGDCYLLKENLNDENSGWSLLEKEKVAVWYRYFMWRKRIGCPGFFQYTPEIMLSWLQEPLVKKLVQNRISGKQSSISSKLHIYKRYFPMQETPTFGYSGFEKFVEIDRHFRPILRSKFGEAEVRIPYVDLVRQLESSLQ